VRVRLYLDEDVDVALAAALRRRGIDVLTTQGAGNVQQRDGDQLAFASQAGRALFTHNVRDFVGLHNEMMREGRAHAGIVVSDQLSLGVLLRRLSKLCFHLAQEEMANRLEFLGTWR
jgi:predicted nuclease of predicted toxin-antitoxin system